MPRNIDLTEAEWTLMEPVSYTHLAGLLRLSSSNFTAGTSTMISILSSIGPDTRDRYRSTYA